MEIQTHAAYYEINITAEETHITITSNSEETQNKTEKEKKSTYDETTEDNKNVTIVSNSEENNKTEAGYNFTNDESNGTESEPNTTIVPYPFVDTNVFQGNNLTSNQSIDNMDETNAMLTPLRILGIVMIIVQCISLKLIFRSGDKRSKEKKMRKKRKRIKRTSRSSTSSSSSEHADGIPTDVVSFQILKSQDNYDDSSVESNALTNISHHGRSSDDSSSDDSCSVSSSYDIDDRISPKNLANSPLDIEFVDNPIIYDSDDLI